MWKFIYYIFMTGFGDVSRARLRTYASYTPTDAELQQISSVYRNHLCRNIQDTES